MPSFFPLLIELATSDPVHEQGGCERAGLMPASVPLACGD